MDGAYELSFGEEFQESFSLVLNLWIPLMDLVSRTGFLNLFMI